MAAIRKTEERGEEARRRAGVSDVEVPLQSTGLSAATAYVNCTRTLVHINIDTGGSQRLDHDTRIAAEESIFYGHSTVGKSGKN